MRASVPQYLALAGSVALLGACLWVMSYRVDWRQLTSIWAEINPYLFVAAAISYWLQYPFFAYRFQCVTRWSVIGFRTPSFGFFLRLVNSAIFLAVVAPVGFAIDAVKITALVVAGNLPKRDAFRCSLFDRVVGIQWLSIAGIATLPI